MKIFNTPFAAAAAAALLLALSPAHASGDHPGGHAAAPTGAPGKAAQVSRTIAVELTDSFRLVPDRIRVRQGETVRFALRNSGQLPHEFVLGSEASNRAHAEEMKRMPGMAHDEPGKLTLAPGAQGDIVWRFTQPDEVEMACLIAGHYDAGMKGSIVVTAGSAQLGAR